MRMINVSDGLTTEEEEAGTFCSRGLASLKSVLGSSPGKGTGKQGLIYMKERRGDVHVSRSVESGKKTYPSAL